MELVKKKENRKTVFILFRDEHRVPFVKRLMRNQIVKLFLFNDKEVVLVV